MKSSKWVFALMAVMLVLALAPSSFAQIQLQIFNTPSASEIQTNRNAQTADPTSTGAGILISGSVVAAAPLTTTNLVLTFPGPITSSGTTTSGNAPNIPGTDPIVLQGLSGLFAGVAISTINFSAGTITIPLPGSFPTPVNMSGSFRLSGVRIDANGKTAPSNVTATLSSSANNYIPPATPTVPLINAFGAGIGSSAVGAITSGPAPDTLGPSSFLIFTNQTNGNFTTPNATLLLTEGFASGWRTLTQSSTNGSGVTNSTQIRVTVNGLPPGTTVNLSKFTNSGSVAFNLLGPTGTGSQITSIGPPTSSNPTANQFVIDFTGTRLTSVDQVEVRMSFSGTPTSLTAGNITATATMFPIGDALDSNGIPAGPGNPNNDIPGDPHFAQTDAGPVTIGTILAANTTLLIPYAVKTGPYDTGIAIANTTADPFASTGGGATPAAGTLTAFLFPRTSTGAGTSVTLTTSATVRPGVGLATDGTLAAGGTWTALMSDILTAAGQTGDFFGYLFIQTNFLDAHGAAYIFNGTGFTSSTEVLVLPPPSANNSRNTPGGGVESLNN